MKLSKAQQTVIDMIREGWCLKLYAIVHPECEFTTGVGKATFKSLVKRGIVEFDGEYYRLTEQYKTAPAGQQETK